MKATVEKKVLKHFMTQTWSCSFILWIKGAFCVVKVSTYFGNIFNWFSLNSKICSLVNLQPSKKSIFISIKHYKKNAHKYLSQ